jgi:hypothetical protein
MRGLGRHYLDEFDLDKSLEYYEMLIARKKEAGGDDALLSDYAMAGRVKLAKFLYGLGGSGQELDQLVAGGLEDLSKALGGWNFEQLRATHDFGLLTWFTCCTAGVDASNVGALENARNSMAGIVEHVPKFPSLADGEKMMVFNNAACAELLWELYDGFEGTAGGAAAAVKLSEETVRIYETADARWIGHGLDGWTYYHNRVLAYIVSGEKKDLERASHLIDEMELRNVQMHGAREGVSNSVRTGQIDSDRLRRLRDLRYAVLYEEGYEKEKKTWAGKYDPELKVCVFDYTN